MTNKKNKKFDTDVMENVLRHLKKTFVKEKIPVTIYK